jgi:hypothetical protein
MIRIRRIRIRDAELFGSPDDAECRYRSRYLPGQQHYFETAHPVEVAHIVVANDDPARFTIRVQSQHVPPRRVATGRSRSRGLAEAADGR